MKTSSKALSSKISILKYALVQVVSKVLVLISTYIIALSATNEIFGYVSLLQASLVTVVTLFGFNLQSGFVRYYYNYHLHHIYNSVRPILLTLSSLAVLSSVILFFIFQYHNFYVWFSLLPIIGFLNGMALVFSMLSRSNDRFKLYLISEIIRPLFLIAVAVSFVFYSFNIVFIYSTALLISLLITLILCFSKRNELILAEYEKQEEVLVTATFFKYTAPLFFVQLMSLMNNVSDRYIMSYYLDISAIGEYGKAYLIGSSLGFFLDSLMLLWMPYVMKNKNGVIAANLNKFQYVAALMCSVSLIILCMGFLLQFLNIEFLGLGAGFISLTVIILAAFIGRIGYQVLTPIISAHDRTSWVAKISLLSMLLGLGLNFLLIPLIGSLGAAVATFLSFFCYSVLAIYLISKLKLELANSGK